MVAVATLLFAAGDTLGKHLAMVYAATLILSARYAINLALGRHRRWDRVTAAKSGARSAPAL
jgi:hypothetical protein